MKDKFNKPALPSSSNSYKSTVEIEKGSELVTINPEAEGNVAINQSSAVKDFTNYLGCFYEN